MKPSLTSSTALSLALALSLGTSTAYANDKDTAAALAGIVALGVIGAAIGHDQHRRGDEDYTNHPRVHPDENAVGRCMHRAKRLVKKAGGDHVELDHVADVKMLNNGNTVVRMQVTGYYPFASKTSNVRCVVHNNKIKKFEF